MTVRDWVYKREIEGLATFSTEDVREAFLGFTQQHVLNDLYRLRKKGVVSQVFRGFYVIIPPHYAAKGIVPPVYYIDQLMDFLDKPYYISLLSAAQLLGAAHQRPQYFCVTTTFPEIHFKRRNTLELNYRSFINNAFLRRKNSETGTILLSGPELTALDLVQHERRIGGLSRAATVIAELSEQIRWEGAAQNGLLAQTTFATVQRLGYILEHVLLQQEQADALYNELKTARAKLNRFPLSSRKDVHGALVNKRWNILVNTTIEIDEL